MNGGLRTNKYMKTKTIDLKGKQYAQVKDRLNEFRSANPRALIETTPMVQADGRVMFKARILTDKADQNSAEATGHALSEKAGEKAFEKLETIAVGRALALLGYASDGEIASSEEMEEFEAFKQDGVKKQVKEAEEKLKATKSLATLGKVWANLPIEVKKELEALKNELKAKHENA